MELTERDGRVKEGLSNAVLSPLNENTVSRLSVAHDVSVSSTYVFDG
jgi:hypothetical protein